VQEQDKKKKTNRCDFGENGGETKVSRRSYSRRREGSYICAHAAGEIPSYPTEKKKDNIKKEGIKYS